MRMSRKMRRKKRPPDTPYTMAEVMEMDTESTITGPGHTLIVLATGRYILYIELLTNFSEVSKSPLLKVSN